LYWIFNINKV